jgi:hypothetical protein
LGVVYGVYSGFLVSEIVRFLRVGFVFLCMSDNMSDEVGVSLSVDAKEILRSVFDRGGSATTSEVKQDTGLDTDKIRYRCSDSKDALAGEYGLVELGRVDPDEYFGNGFPPKLIELTEKGESFIERGLVGKGMFEGDDEVSVSMEQFEEFRGRLGRLENRVNSVLQGDFEGGSSSSVGEGKVEELREEVESLREDFDEFEREWELFVGEYGGFYEDVVNNFEPLMRGVLAALEEDGVEVGEFVDEGSGESSVVRDFGGGE